eukprot:2913231-Pyramimonas_sp.AAC.1
MRGRTSFSLRPISCPKATAPSSPSPLCERSSCSRKGLSSTPAARCRAPFGPIWPPDSHAPGQSDGLVAAQPTEATPGYIPAPAKQAILQYPRTISTIRIVNDLNGEIRTAAHLVPREVHGDEKPVALQHIA